MIIYKVTQQYYNNGKVNVSFHRLDLSSKPENEYKEYPYFDLYNDYFTAEKEAEKFFKEVLKHKK